MQPRVATRALLAPALGTGYGFMSHAQAARQMAAAYRVVMLGKRPTAAAILRQHRELIRP